LFGVAVIFTVDVLPLPSPAVYLDTSVALIVVTVADKIVNTLDVVDVCPLLHLMMLVAGAPGFPLLAASIVQFVAFVAVVELLLVPPVMPLGPEQLVILMFVAVTGFTVLIDENGGRPGV
jgi:hypothetical protein